MEDKLFKFRDVEPNANTTETTSLVISEVPSKVAYDILSTALATNKDVSPELIRALIEKRLSESSVHVTYDEFRRVLSAVPLNEIMYYKDKDPIRVIDGEGLVDRSVLSSRKEPDHDLDEDDRERFARVETPSHREENEGGLELGGRSL